MTDIVERLRGHSTNKSFVHPLFAEAAEVIEALETKLAWKRADIDTRMREMQVEIDGLNRKLRDKLDHQSRENGRQFDSMRTELEKQILHLTAERDLLVRLKEIVER